MNIIKKFTVCFTGHRKIKQEQFDIIFQQLEKTLEKVIKKGYRYFEIGGALGFDTIAAETVLKLKYKYPYIKLILVLPCMTQTRGWKEKDIDIYENIKQQADKVVYISKEYTRGCMHKRNRYLIDNSSLCICYPTKFSGGTAYTVNYAINKGLDVINIAIK